MPHRLMVDTFYSAKYNFLLLKVELKTQNELDMLMEVGILLATFNLI